MQWVDIVNITYIKIIQMFHGELRNSLYGAKMNL